MEVIWKLRKMRLSIFTLIIHEGNFLYKNYLRIKKEEDLSFQEFATKLGVSKSKLYDLFKDKVIEYKYKNKIFKNLKLVFPKSEDKAEIEFDETIKAFENLEKDIEIQSLKTQLKVALEREVIYKIEIERLKNK